MKNIPNARKLLFGLITICALACAAIVLRLLTEPAADPLAPDSTHSLYLNSVKPDPADIPLLEESHAYVCGALLYQSRAISSYFPDGGSLGLITRQGDTLTVTDGTGKSLAFPLAEVRTYSPEEFQRQLAPVFMKGEFEEFSTLFPTDTESITHFMYQNTEAAEPQTLHLWEAVSVSAGNRLWFGDISIRLYALIDLYEALPFSANGALWTFDPHASTAIPIRFDLDGPVTVTANRLSSSISGEQTSELTVHCGETIYWWPFANGTIQDGTIRDGTALEYRFQWDGLSSGETEWREKLELRSFMDYAGLYGSQTYGVANNWLGLASSALHPSALQIDSETGELVICICKDSPYAAGIAGAGIIRGRHTPPQVMDATEIAPG